LDSSPCYDSLKTPIHIWSMVVKMMDIIICKNGYLHFEHAGQDNNFVVDKTNLSVIKFDENHCEMTQFD
jgi:hypothetical protein